MGDKKVTKDPPPIVWKETPPSPCIGPVATGRLRRAGLWEALNTKQAQLFTKYQRLADIKIFFQFNIIVFKITGFSKFPPPLKKSGFHFFSPKSCAMLWNELKINFPIISCEIWSFKILWIVGKKKSSQKMRYVL